MEGQYATARSFQHVPLHRPLHYNRLDCTFLGARDKIELCLLALEAGRANNGLTDYEVRASTSGLPRRLAITLG
ncbi:hypothetical protein J6590_056322 [Homalodisca vitripennis]|nr:hypothetical protein J6590_056322 [Homalodisca vitripennis]